jgi:predicted transcriptional regulator/plasmid stabilization system protein ParE
VSSGHCSEPILSTTTLKLSEELKARIAPLAASAGTTPHAWMIEALQAQAALADLRQAFVREARERTAVADAGGPLAVVAASPSRQMPRVVLVLGALEDLERIHDFPGAHPPERAAETFEVILDALAILERHPAIGRPVDGTLRELAISFGATGCVAL